jgi:hypothetical protein
MADTFRDYVKMSFINASGKTSNIQLRYPKADLTTLELETAMDLILAIVNRNMYHKINQRVYHL